MCAATTSLLGCDEDKPYTPFQVATALPEDESSPKPKEPPRDEEKSTPRWSPSLRAPLGSETWKVFERTLKAPPGTELHVALTRLNGEPDEVIAWALPRGAKKKPGSEPGVWVFDEAGKPLRRLLSLPDYLPQGADCQLRADLEGTGSATLTARIFAQCSSRLLPGTPVSGVVVLEPNRSEPELVHLRSQEASPGERLDLVVDSHDHDGDGIDDIKITAELAAPSGAKESLPFVWLSRTAGASRTPDSPGAELKKRSSRLAIAAVRKAERAEAPDSVDALRRLTSAVCAELGRPRLFRGNGDGLSCGNIQPSLEELAQVEIQAFLGQGQLERALGAFERATWFGKAFDGARKKKLEKLIRDAIPHQEAKRAARFSVKPKALAGPYASPLHFTSDGQLFAITTETTKRLTMEGDPPLVVPATDDEPEQRIEPPSWEMLLRDSKGMALQAALPSCDRSEVLLAFSTEKVGETPSPVPLPMLAPRPGTCKAFAPTPLDVIPLFVEGGAISAVVGGERVTTRGTVREPSRAVAWNTSLGVALREGAKLTLLTGSIAEGLHHCVVDQKSKEIACVGPDSVSVLSAPQ